MRENENSGMQECSVDPKNIAYMAIIGSDNQIDASNQTWIVDTGCSSHMTSDPNILSNLSKLIAPKSISVGNNASIPAIGSGTIHAKQGTFKDVLYVPLISRNLFSARQASDDLNLYWIGGSKSIVFYDKQDNRVFSGERYGDVYILILDIFPPSEFALLATTVDQWHKRFSHLPKQLIVKMINEKIVDGLEVTNKERDQCVDCALNKCRRSSHPTSTSQKAIRPAETLHFDLIGKIAPASLGGAQYILTCRDEFSSFRMTICLSRKSAVRDAVKLMLNQAQQQTGNKVFKLVCDNGTEFAKDSLKIFLQHNGIANTLSAPYTPQQNGTAESENKKIIIQACSLLNSAKLPFDLWAEAVNASTYVANRSISRKRLITPFELWRGTKPKVDNLRVFGQQAVVLNTKTQKSNKFDEKGILMNFVGYTENHQTYRFYDAKTKSVITSCDVFFLEKFEPISTETHDEIQLIPQSVSCQVNKSILHLSDLNSRILSMSANCNEKSEVLEHSRDHDRESPEMGRNERDDIDDKYEANEIAFCGAPINSRDHATEHETRDSRYESPDTNKNTPSIQKKQPITHEDPSIEEDKCSKVLIIPTSVQIPHPTAEPVSAGPKTSTPKKGFCEPR